MKRHVKALAAIGGAAILMAAVVGCSNQPVSSGSAGGSSNTSESSTSAESKSNTGDSGQVTVRFGGGPSSGANYTTFSGICNLISEDHPNYLCSTEITTGSQENLRMIQNGTVDFGVAMSDTELYAFKGEREFEGSAIPICHVMGGYTTMLHMMVPKDSSINSIADLKGKKLAVSKGTMAQYYMPILLEAYGLTKDDVTITEMPLQDICNAVSDGNADFGVHITPYTSSPIADLAATKGIKLLSIDQEHIDKIVEKYPYFYKATIPADTYTGVGETTVIGTRNNLVCGKDVPDEVVYNVTKSIIEHNDKLADIHPQAVNFNKENAVKDVLIDIHPGAEKYYKEIGIM